MFLLIVILASLPIFPLTVEKIAVMFVPDEVDIKSLSEFEIIEESKAVFKEGRFEGVYSVLWELRESNEIIYTHDLVYKVSFSVYTINGGIMKAGPDGKPTGEIYVGYGYPLKMAMGDTTYDVKVCFIYYPPHQTSFWMIFYKYVTSHRG